MYRCNSISHESMLLNENCVTLLDDHNSTIKSFDLTNDTSMPIPPVMHYYYIVDMVPWSQGLQGSNHVEKNLSRKIFRNNYNEKQLAVTKTYKKLKCAFSARKKLVKKITIDEKCFALRLSGYSAKHIESLSRALFHFDYKTEMQEISIYLARRNNNYIKGMTAYVKIRNNIEKETIFDICKRYDLKVTFLGDSQTKQ